MAELWCWSRFVSITCNIICIVRNEDAVVRLFRRLGPIGLTGRTLCQAVSSHKKCSPACVGSSLLAAIELRMESERFV